MISMKSNYVNHKTTADCYGFKNDDGTLKFPQTLNVWVIMTHSSYSSSSKDYDGYVLTRLKRWGN